MAETEARPREWFAPLTTLATVVVAVWSLYYSGVQADVARKTFEMTVNEAHAGLQQDLADLQQQLAAGSTDRNLADLLGRMGNLQAKLAEQQRRSVTSEAGSLADVQQQMADLQAAVAQLKREHDRKDQEIAALRASLAVAAAPRLAASPTGTGTAPLVSLPSEFSILTNKYGVPATAWKLTPTPAMPVADETFFSKAKAILGDVGAIFRAYPGLTFYFVVASLMALSKLFGRP